MNIEMSIGKKTHETGYVWAPYVPMDTRVIIEGRRMRALQDLWGFPIRNNIPVNGKKSVISRYSQIANENKYQTISINEI